MTLNEFTPEEIVFLYLRHERYMQVHEDVKESIKELNKEGVETVPTLKDLKDNEHIKMLEVLNAKLKPIYEIITEAQPEIYTEMKRVTENPMNLPESPLEEEDFFDEEDDEEDNEY